MHLLLKLTWFLVFVVVTHQSNSTRILNDQVQTPHLSHPTIVFFMQDILFGKYQFSRPPTTPVDNQMPHHPSVGVLYPPNEGNPLPESVPFSRPTMDLSGFSLSFPTITPLESMSFGLMTTIDEMLIEGPLFRSSLLGKAQGVYVANLDDKSSHMMAMTVKFINGDFKDSLRFFGVYQPSLSESHIAVIGGTGKFHGANGYATVKAVAVGSNGEVGGARKFLLFTIYLSHSGV